MGNRGFLSRQERQALSEVRHGQGELPAIEPAGLSDEGLAIWAAVYRLCPWLTEVDAPVVEHLARLEEEAAAYREALAERGPLIEEPIVSPRGEVVGNKVVANPAEAMLRRTERMLLDVRKSLALSPVERARLGLVVNELRRRASGTSRAEDLLTALTAESGSD